MSNAIEVGETVANGIVSLGAMNEAKSKYDFVVAAEQAIAYLGAIALNPVTAGFAIATNAGAATGTLGKILSDIRDKGSIELNDLASLAGNVAVIATAVAVSINPACKAAQIAAGIAKGIGWIGLSGYVIDKAKADDNIPFTPTSSLQSENFITDLQKQFTQAQAARGARKACTAEAGAQSIAVEMTNDEV